MVNASPFKFCVSLCFPDVEDQALFCLAVYCTGLAGMPAGLSSKAYQGQSIDTTRSNKLSLWPWLKGLILCTVRFWHY